MKGWILALFLSSITAFSQIDSSLQKYAKPALIAGNASLYAFFTYQASYQFFNAIEYTPWKNKNDLSYWKGMDKAFHLYLTTSITSTNYHLYHGFGFTKKQSIALAAGNTFLIALTKEWIDAHIDVAGFSMLDMVANTIGIASSLYQEHLWNHQKIIFKYSFHQSPWAQYNPSELGASTLTQTFRDYNGMTFWISTLITTFTKLHDDRSSLGLWDIVSVAFGYSVDGMLSSKTNTVIEFQNNSEPVERVNEFFLGLDVHLSNIPTKSKLLKNLFFVLDHVKVPLPTIEYSTDRKLSFHPLYF